MIYDPCKIADSTEKQFSFRPEASELDKKGKIKLKPFMTDYTRINNYLSEQKEELEKYSPKKEIKNNQIENYISNNTNNNPSNEKTASLTEENAENKYFYLQPVMKFAPRTEFERIYDTLNSYEYGRIDKNLIKDQLKTLGFLTVQNYKNDFCSNEYSLLKEKFKVSSPTLAYLIKEKARLEKQAKTPETKDLLTNITDIIKINKEIINEQREERMSTFEKENNKKIDSNKKKIIKHLFAKKLLSDYQKKTHFKALLNCTLNLFFGAIPLHTILKNF
jgi:hypothetical protein